MKNRNTNKIYRIYQSRKQQNDYCELKDISKYIIKYVLLLEDPSFFNHGAINIQSIYKAIQNNIKGGNIQGGSSITQQLVKNIYFKFEINYIRKIKELLLAIKYEKTLSKDEILELYLNIIYYDNGQYGITNACKFYFNKKPSDVTCNQAYFLARVLPIVGIFNPLYHPKEFLAFRKQRLEDIRIDNSVSEAEYKEIISHNELCLDEKLCKPTKQTEKYNKLGPMINERFGPGQKESLLEITKRKQL